MVVLGTAGDIAVDMPVQFQPACDAGGDQRLEGPEHGRSTDPSIAPPHPLPEVTGRDLAALRRKRIGDLQPLARHPLAGLTQAVDGRLAGQCPPTTPANAEKA